MSAWLDCILKNFPSELTHLWIAVDPDGVLLDERLLAGLRGNGFDLLPFEDSVVFRAEYEAGYRSVWAQKDGDPARSLILQIRSTDSGDLPWDYLTRARTVNLSLADLFPKLAYSVIQQIDPEYRDALYNAQTRYASQSIGESATKDFVLTHIFRINAQLINAPEEFWRELLRLHRRNDVLPPILADHVARILSDIAALRTLPLRELLASKSFFLSTLQGAWYCYLATRGITGKHKDESLQAVLPGNDEIPFEHPDIRAIVGSMFLEGQLHPLTVLSAPAAVPEWARNGIVEDPLALRHLVEEGIKEFSRALPGTESAYRDWINAAARFGELLARYHSLDWESAQFLEPSLFELQAATDRSLLEWFRGHYADLPSLPAAKAPVMVHHIPRFLSMRRGSGEDRVALVVFDGLAIDQWIQIRDALAKRVPNIRFDEGACFAWAPTLTSISRQAIFSGQRPREFADSIESTSSEPAQWSRFWLDHGLREHEIVFSKGLQRNEHLGDLAQMLSSPSVRAAGLVVDTVDEIVHGAALGKRGVATQIESWVESGFVEQLFSLLHGEGFHVYLTADHGNVDAIGQGRPMQGVAAELRGERVRTYRSEALAVDSSSRNVNTYRVDIAGLPADFLSLFSGGRTAFIPKGKRAVVHGGISIEELVVPFVRVSM